MRLHNAGLQAIVAMGLLGLLMLTGYAYHFMLYSGLITLFLFRNPKRSPGSGYFISPTSGFIDEIRLVQVNGKQMRLVTIETLPVIHPQTIAGSNHMLSTKQLNGCLELIYKNSHAECMPRFGAFVSSGRDISLVVGHSVFGCTTKVYLPYNLKLNVTEGQTVIDSETVLGELV